MPVAAASPILRHQAVALVTQGDLGIIAWTGQPDLAANRWVVDQLSNRLLSKQPSSLLLQFIAASSGTPDAAARAFVQDAFRNQLTSVRRMVTVPLGDSLKQSLVRTIMRGMIILSGRMSRAAVASSTEEALSIISVAAGPETPSRRELLVTLRALFEAAGVPDPLPSA